MINIINACNSPHYFISQGNQSTFIYDFDYEVYKYKALEVYALKSDDLSKKELIAEYDLTPEFRVDNFNILDLSSMYYKQKGTLTISIDSDSSSISVSKNDDKYGLGLNDIFKDDFNNYNITSCVKENEDKITVLRMDSQKDDSYIEVFIQLN